MFYKIFIHNYSCQGRNYTFIFRDVLLHPRNPSVTLLEDKNCNAKVVHHSHSLTHTHTNTQKHTQPRLKNKRKLSYFKMSIFLKNKTVLLSSVISLSCNGAQISKHTIRAQHAADPGELSVCKDPAGMLMHLPIFLQRSSPLLCMIIGE